VGSEAPHPRPALEVVTEPGEPQVEEPRIWLRAFLAVGVLLLLALLALGVQTRRIGELEGRVEALGAELGSARDELAAHEDRLDRARGLLDDLGGRLQELRTLLAPAPAAGGPEETL
jgi:Tfp pilus assembly protein PilN